MQRTLNSGHLSIVDIIFRSQFTSPPRNDLSLADTSNNGPHKIFLARNLFSFYFRQCFIVLFKFSSIFVILLFSQFNSLFSSIKKKIRWDFQSVFTAMVDVYPSCKDFQCAMRQRQIYGHNQGDFYSIFLSRLLVDSFTHCKHSPTSCFQIII